MHDLSLAHTHGGRSTLQDNFDILPKFMDNTPNNDKIYTDETHDFIKLYNAANDDNDATDNYNDSPYPTDSDFCVNIIHQMNSYKRSVLRINK